MITLNLSEQEVDDLRAALHRAFHSALRAASSKPEPDRARLRSEALRYDQLRHRL